MGREADRRPPTHQPAGVRGRPPELPRVPERLGATGELQSQTSLAALIRKLPSHLQTRWREVAYELKEREGKRPALEDIVRFVGRVAAVAADPVYGSSGPRTSRPDRSAPRSSYAAYADVDCPVCEEGSHKARDCPSFLKESPGGRLQAAIRAKLCFVCLRTGHITRECPDREICSVRGCQHWHATELHEADWTQFRRSGRRQRSARRKEEPRESQETPQALYDPPAPEAHYSMSFHARCAKIALPLLPVSLQRRDRGLSRDLRPLG